MSVEDNIRVMENALNAINERNWDGFGDLQAESVILHSSMRPEPVKGRAGVREFLETMTKTFPDLRVKKERAFGHGDWVLLEQVSTGTHKGPLPRPGGQPIPPTNKSIRWTVALVAKVEGGKISEVHQYVDRLGILEQMGVAPGPSP